MRSALVPGSYDPITVGHLDVIRRAAQMFDRVTVLVAHNNAKNYLLCSQKRLALAEDAIKDIPGVLAEGYDGMLIDYIASHDRPDSYKRCAKRKRFCL